MLHERKVESGHGDGVVRQLSVDLKERYPKMGLSPRNLWYMKRFYLRYCGSDVKVQRSVALLPWSHNVYLLGKNLDDSGQMHHALLSSIETDRVLTKGKSSETDTVILQLIEQTISRLKFTFSGNGFLYLRQSVSEFFHQVARCVNGITSIIGEFHRYQHSLCHKF